MKIHLNHYTLILTLFLTLISLTITAYGTTYFVDYVNGDDNNNGMTQTQAFKHSPGDPLATGIAGSLGLQAGDIVQFKGGVEYKGQVIVSASGDANNYIIYRGQGWGPGRATFNMEDTRQYGFKGNQTYLIITGFNFYNYASSGSDYVIYPTNGASNWIIDSCSIAYIKDWNSTNIFPDRPCIFLSLSISNITIENCEFFASGRTVVRLGYVSYVTIKRCNFGGINRGNESGWFSVGIRGEASCNNIRIEDNIFHDGWQYGGDQVPELNHAPAFIHIYGLNANTYPDKIYIERNYFYNDRAFLTGTGTGSVEIETQVHDVYIRNNIFANACQYWGSQLLLSDHCDNIYVENNTFIDRVYATGYGVNSLKVYLDSSAPAGDNIFIWNNIFWSDANGSNDCCVYFNGSGTFRGIIDNNAYYRSNLNQINNYHGSIVSLATWQIYGFDTNSKLYKTTDPAFIYMPSTGETTSSGNYSIDSNAVGLIDKGITLTGFDDSYNGVSRPQGAAWDIGAYEFDGSVPKSNMIFPELFELRQNYPNPFNPSTTIEYTIPKSSYVQIKVYDMTGREVKTLVDEFQQNGNYRLKLDARNLSAGIYFYRLIGDNFTQTKKMILLK